MPTADPTPSGHTNHPIGLHGQQAPVPIRYAVYLPDCSGASTSALAECLTYVQQQHPDWENTGVIVGRWPGAAAMLMGGQVDVVLVAQKSDLPPDRTPRVVSVEEELMFSTAQTPAPTAAPGAPTRRRPRQAI